MPYVTVNSRVPLLLLIFTIVSVKKKIFFFYTSLFNIVRFSDFIRRTLYTQHHQLRLRLRPSMPSMYTIILYVHTRSVLVFMPTLILSLRRKGDANDEHKNKYVVGYATGTAFSALFIGTIKYSMFRIIFNGMNVLH